LAEKVSLSRRVQIMGHDSPDTTMREFQGSPEDLQQAVEQITRE
jgi:hypothetical protein